MTSATIILTIASFHDPFKSLACNSLGAVGNVGSVSGQSCVGEYGKSFFQILI